MTTSPTTFKQKVSYIYCGISCLGPHEGFPTCKSHLQLEKARGGNESCSAFSSTTKVLIYCIALFPNRSRGSR